MLKIIVVSILLAISSCSCDDGDLQNYCERPTSCWISEGQVHIVDDIEDFRDFNPGSESRCGLGLLTCDEDTGEIGCENYKPPS